MNVRHIVHYVVKLTSKGVEFTSKSVKFTSKCLKLTSKTLKFTSKSAKFTSKLLQLTSKGVKYTSKCLKLTSKQAKYTSKRRFMSESGIHESIFCILACFNTIEEIEEGNNFAFIGNYWCWRILFIKIKYSSFLQL
ncbi:hypothetical protein [Peribacillus sp. JNUCC41]|uniref:hypothetical protein n=1 Tax=Peribacillus sp. JNUCC41 TaxID=2778370 RepID=UPI00177B22A3|nr:hypothetical protein [Brevibacillus sp. JNUCC-41]QOS91015.1 hypothetical protein JNUCC41_04425 [Brevibacillus sp. JNUCC-41]